MNYPKTILNLIECFKKFPGIGEKTAERLALASINMDNDIVDLFSKSLKDGKTKIKKCSRCGSLNRRRFMPNMPRSNSRHLYSMCR